MIELDNNPHKVSDFFNNGEMIWNKPNIDIENKLLALAEIEGVKVDEEGYPDLIKWL